MHSSHQNQGRSPRGAEAIEKPTAARPGTPDRDPLDVLDGLVERYEEQVDAIEPPASIEALSYHMESRGITRRDLEPFIGSRARERKSCIAGVR